MNRFKKKTYELVDPDTNEKVGVIVLTRCVDGSYDSIDILNDDGSYHSLYGAARIVVCNSGNKIECSYHINGSYLLRSEYYASVDELTKQEEELKNLQKKAEEFGYKLVPLR